MKRLLLALLSFVPLLAQAGEKPNTILLHPGEVIYARFAEHGKKLKLLGTTKEKDETAQLILQLENNPKDNGMTLTLHNRFGKDLLYAVEMRLLKSHLHQPATVYPVVSGKMSFDPIPYGTEELAVTDFELIL